MTRPTLLLAQLSAQAQSLLTGVTDTFCSSRGGRFTYTGTAGSSVANYGECYIPPSLPSVGAATSGLGRTANTLGAASNLLGSFLTLKDQIDEMNGPDDGPGNSARAPSNDDALTLDTYAVTPITDDPALADLVAGDPSLRSYALLGVLGDPAVANQIGQACAGSTQATQLACVTGQITEALMARLPSAAQNCADKEDPERAICAARMQMEAVGLNPGDCVGQCPLRLVLAARMYSP